MMPSGANAVVQMWKDRQEAYTAGYRSGYQEGVEAGIDELLSENVIDKRTAGNIRHMELSSLTIIFSTGWDSDLNDFQSKSINYENGEQMGRGRGMDDGYETVMARYGYARKYSAIPSGNITSARLDNGGTCVYCNAVPTADVDHVYPLKHHWRERGAIQGQGTRSAEANDMDNLVGSCAACNRSKGARRLGNEWWPPLWPHGTWWPHGPLRAQQNNTPPPYW